MLLVLREFFTSNMEVTRTIPNLELLVQSLHVLLDEIHSASQLQIIHRQGAGANKKQLKEHLIRLSSDVSRKLAACAALSGNVVLLCEIKTSDTSLLRMPEEKLVAFCKILLDKGSRQLSQTAPYGLNRQNLDELDTALKAFVGAIAEPRMGIIGKKLATKDLASHFKAVGELLVKFDLLAGIVKLNRPDFYSGYRNARLIVDHAGRRLQLIVSVVDKVNGKKIQGALCTVALSNRPDRTILFKKSAAKGSLKIKSLESGNYLLAIAKSGYQKQTMALAVTKGKFLRVGVEMEQMKNEK